MQDKKPRNAKGRRHGLWTHTDDNGEVVAKGEYIDGQPVGFWQTYNIKGLYMYLFFAR